MNLLTIFYGSGNRGEESKTLRNLVTAAKAVGIGDVFHNSVARAGDHKNFVGWNEGRWEPTYWEEKAASINIVNETGFS